MIATITHSSSVMDYPIMRNSNTAGGPLPLIPRRSSASRLPLAKVSTPQPVSPVVVNVQTPTPPDSDEKSKQETSAVMPEETLSSSSEASTSTSSSSSTKLFLRPKRVLGAQRSLPPREPSSPTLTLSRTKKDLRPRVRSSEETESAKSELTHASLRLDLDGSKQRYYSESHLPDPLLSKSAPPSSTPPMIRKKSGQVVKSSLKGTRSTPRPGLSVFTAMTSSKSEPNTPTLSKAVHFDKQLEHVKLFLAEQKPLAVSRDGSPTDDTSGTDSDFPSFIFGDSYGDKLPKQRLLMTVANMPRAVDLSADIVLESLLLSNDGTTIQGRVRVRNMAFQKWIAVRFTFDAWQTTSEVTAKWAQSLSETFDIFTFSIKLNDLLARIEEKTMVLALRYSVLGREIWDNNNGSNYVATFSRIKAAPARAKANSGSNSGSDIMDLKTKLERVIQKRDADSVADVPPFRVARAASVAGSGAPQDSPESLKGALSSRYDISNLLKPTRQSPPASNSVRSRTHTYPAASPPMASPPSSIPWPSKEPAAMTKNKELGSPRDSDGDVFRPSPYVPLEPHERPFAVTRHHQRGYFDIGFAPVSTLKRTPPRMRSADESTPVPRAHSYRDMPLLGLMLSRDAEGTASDESTPSIVSPSSGSDQDSSPAHSPGDLEFSQSTEKSNDTPNANYHHFLNQFCFYTGVDGLSLDTSSDISRSSSLSSVDDILSTSPRMSTFVSQTFSQNTLSQTPTPMPRSPGTSTPTPMMYSKPPAAS